MPAAEIPVILNPFARSARAAGKAEMIAKLSPRARLVPLGSGDGESAEALACALADEGYPVVAAAGGDGTVNAVANGIARSKNAATCALGLLPSGTMNVFSRELELPFGDLPKCWERIVAGSAREVDLWAANDRFFVQLAGVGFDAAVIQDTPWERKKSLGPLSYMVSAFQRLGKESAPLRIEVPGEDPREGAAVLLGNGQRYGGPLKLFRQASLDDGLIDVLILRRDDFGGLLSVLWSAGPLAQHTMEGLTYLQAPALSIRSTDPDCDAPFEVDGELAGETPVQITRAPHRLRVMC